MAASSLAVEYLPSPPRNFSYGEPQDGQSPRKPDGKLLGDYSLGEPAEAVYDNLKKDRQAVIDTARLMAELTIPSLVPPDGWLVGSKLPGNNQSLGSRCVNNLAASLLFMAFPPNQPIMKLEAIEYEVQEEIDQDPELWAKLEVALSRLSEAHRKRLLSSTTIISAYHTAMKLLIVAGNGLWKHIKLSSPTVHDPNHYVVKRNALFEPLLVIHKECLSLASLADDFRAQILEDCPEINDKPQWEQTADVYSVCRLDADDGGKAVWHYWQEHKGKLLEGTEMETEYDDCPMIPLGMIPVYGQDWARSYAEEYRGDLFTAEALSSATNDGAALAALSLLFVNPGGRTSIKQIREARNLSTFAGKADDLSVFRAEKGGDFAFVKSVAETVDKRLGMAFLLNFAIQRSGERVTAEEIRRLGNELDKALGGQYSELAQRTTRPIMLRFIKLNEEENPKLPKLPKGVVQVQVITGVDALGNSKEADDLIEFGTNIATMFPKDAPRILNAEGFAMRLAAAKGIKPDGIVNSPEKIAQQEQQDKQAMMQQSLVDKGAGPAVKGLADSYMQAQQGPAPEGPAQ